MTAPVIRDVGDSGRSPAPGWFLRRLAERAAELLAEVDRRPPDWQERVERWREVFDEVQRNG